MADREENGWEVVRYYMSDDLADDSSDEKAINRARREALASIKKKRAKKGETFRNASHSRYNNEHETGDKYSKSQRAGKDGYGRDDKSGIICYGCGIEGHMQFACPEKYGRR